MSNPSNPTRGSFHDFADALGFPASGIAGVDSIMTSCAALTRMPGMPGAGKDGSGLSIGAVHAYISRLTGTCTASSDGTFDKNAFFRANGITPPAEVAREGNPQADLNVTAASLDAIANQPIARSDLSAVPSLADPSLRADTGRKVTARVGLARPSPFGEG